MTWAALLLFLAVVFLAYSNGANDNFKGVATLYGSGTTSYRRALLWAMVTTLAGSVTAIVLGGALVKAFSGKGLVSATALADSRFLLSVCTGAAATCFLATVLGFPVSTTHSIIGALIGAGAIAPGGVNFNLLGKTFALPLLLTPFVAGLASLILYIIFRRIRLAIGVTRETCICAGECEEVVATESPALTIAEVDGRHVLLRSHNGKTEIRKRLGIVIDSEARCIQNYGGKIIGMNAHSVLNILHYLSAGAVGFARGLQDTAKIVGLLVGAALLNVNISGDMVQGILLVGIAMAVGGVLSSRKVADTLSNKILDMNHGQGFTANLVTFGLVIGTALGGMPVSTTHCSVGALFGIAAVNGTARWKMIGQIVLAWIITLPLGALLAIGVYSIML